MGFTPTTCPQPITLTQTLDNACFGVGTNSDALFKDSILNL